MSTDSALSMPAAPLLLPVATPPITPHAAIQPISDTGDLPHTIPVSQLRLRGLDSERISAAKAPEAIRLHATLRVVRGRRLNAEFPLYEGNNLVGRRDDGRVDVDVSDLEPPDRIWSSRRHAIITVTNGQVSIEDLSSLNGTFVNRQRVEPGAPHALKNQDVIQIGTIQLKLTV